MNNENGFAVVSFECLSNYVDHLMHIINIPLSGLPQTSAWRPKPGAGTACLLMWT